MKKSVQTNKIDLSMNKEKDNNNSYLNTSMNNNSIRKSEIGLNNIIFIFNK